MYLYSIMPLDTDHVDEICNDIKEQYENGVANCAMFKMTLVPEGTPPADKAGTFCKAYDVFRDRLHLMGLRSGILVQASIGHGYDLNEMFPFQQYVNLTDGEPQNVCCPYDKAFREHFRGVMKTLAEHSPAEIMVDDDFRLTFRAGRGCACPLHMAEFNRRAGLQLTREELFAHTEGTGEEDIRLTEIFIETQKDSLLLAAKAMREGIDEVDPKLRGTFCACGPAAEFAAEIASILAGEGNAAVIRINNGVYCRPGARGLSDASFGAATQGTIIRHDAEKLGLRIEAILAETDTCPQNRYSTSAQFLHSHFTASILEGLTGAKHWITRLHAYEPDSGRAYRRKLSEYRRFYEKLSELAAQAEWMGCRVPLSKRPGYGYASCRVATLYCGWSWCALERLGLPLYFSEKSGGAAFMDGGADMKFSDEELREMFRGTVILAGDTALRLQERGFVDYTGVEVKEWNGACVSGEHIYVNERCVQGQKNAYELVPVGEGAEELSYSYHMSDGKTRIRLFPGTVVYKNRIGGRCVTFCGTPQTELIHTEGFSFLNESRKFQLVSILKEAGCLPVYYPEDAEIYLKAARLPGGKLLVAVFNIGFDVLEELPLITDAEDCGIAKVKKIEKLMPDGTLSNCAFETCGTADGDGELIKVKTHTQTLEPLILVLE